jgi:hypothetical protein
LILLASSAPWLRENGCRAIPPRKSYRQSRRTAILHRHCARAATAPRLGICEDTSHGHQNRQHCEIREMSRKSWLGIGSIWGSVGLNSTKHRESEKDHLKNPLKFYDLFKGMVRIEGAKHLAHEREKKAALGRVYLPKRLSYFAIPITILHLRSTTTGSPATTPTVSPLAIRALINRSQCQRIHGSGSSTLAESESSG